MRGVGGGVGRAAQRDIETHYSEEAIGERITERLETIGIRHRWPEFQREIHERFDEYQRLPEQIRQTLRESAPDGARVLVVSKGDERLTDLGDCEGWHFPQADDGSQTSAEEDSLAETLLTRLGIPTHPVVADEYEKAANEVIPVGQDGDDETEPEKVAEKAEVEAAPDAMIGCE